MRITFYSFTLFVFVIPFLSTQSRADSMPDLAEKYYRQMHNMDGTAGVIVWAELFEEVPLADRDELFASILDLGAKDSAKVTTNPSATEWILGSLTEKGRSKRAWSAHLEHAVLAVVNNKNLGVRALLPEILAAHDKEKHRTLCLFYLDDPDDVVRCRAVDSVEDWPDARAILSNFVRNHQVKRPNNPADPVLRAKQLLSR